MTGRAKAPTALLVASLAVVTQFILLLAAGYLEVPILQGALVLLLVSLLVLGSRAGWTFMLIGAIWDVAIRFGGEQPQWMLGLDGLLIVALLVPSSIRFIWTDRPPRRFVWPRSPAWLSALSPVVNRVGQLRYGSLALTCGTVLLLLLVPSGMIQEWQEGSGRNSTLAEVLEVMTDAMFTVALIAFIVTLSVWAYRSLGMSSRRE